MSFNTQCNAINRTVSMLGESESFIRLRTNVKRINLFAKFLLPSDNLLRLSIASRYYSIMPSDICMYIK